MAQRCSTHQAPIVNLGFYACGCRVFLQGADRERATATQRPPTIRDCLQGYAATGEPLPKLEALDAWMRWRGTATLSVGYVQADELHRCTVEAYEQSFSASSSSGGFDGTWQSILWALEMCENFESHRPPASDTL
jgi:hypothetical protein